MNRLKIVKEFDQKCQVLCVFIIKVLWEYALKLLMPSNWNKILLIIKIMNFLGLKLS